MRKRWSNGSLLAARVSGKSIFPYSVHLKRPTTSDLASRFDDVRNWIKALENESKPRIGYGYEIDWMTHNHRQLGPNRVPRQIVVPTEADALSMLSETGNAELFQQLAEVTMRAFPVLANWLYRRPLTALPYANDWPRILDALQWFCRNSDSNLYLRQVDIAGVDTKFIEDRISLFTELMDEVMPKPTRVECSTIRDFERRVGLRSKPLPVRFRLLDKRLYIRGLSDISVPASDFARLEPDVKTIFVTENEINGLVFPDVPASLVVFGLGYGLERLSQASWLKTTRIFYWGDIDTHGFVMLDRVRAIFPQTESLLMDRDTLILHKSQWVEESQPSYAEPHRLQAHERSLFQDLIGNRLGFRVRLEQERIAFGWAESEIRRVASGMDQSYWSSTI